MKPSDSEEAIAEEAIAEEAIASELLGFFVFAAAAENLPKQTRREIARALKTCARKLHPHTADVLYIMGLNEAINALDGVEADAFAKRLQADAAGLYKHIYSDGYGAGKTAQKTETKKAESKASDLEEERNALQERIGDLEEEQPEAAELRGEYEEKLKRKQQSLNEAKAEVEAARKEGQKALRAQSREMFGERLNAFFASKGVEEDARKYSVFNALQSDRVAFDDDLSPVVYEPDGETPTPLADHQAPHEALGESLLENIPESHIRDRKANATGASPGGGGGTSFTTSQIENMSDAEYAEKRDDIRAAQREGRIAQQ